MKIARESKSYTLELLLAIMLAFGFCGNNLKKVSAQTSTASIYVSFSPVSVNAGATTTMSVGVVSGGYPVVAVDSMLSYDTNRFTVSSITPNTNTNFKTFLPLNSGQNGFDWTKAVNSAQSTIDFSGVSFNLNVGSTTPPNGGNFALGNIVFLAKPARRDTVTQVTVNFSAGNMTDSNIVSSADFTDVLKAVSNASVKVVAEPICRAAIDIRDQIPNTNDLLYITAKPWNSSCSGCLEDLNGDGVINTADLLYIVAYWGQTCQVPANTP